MPAPASIQCPCQSGLPYSECCEKFHLGAKATTPKLLMASRYSAFALHIADYLEKTTHARLKSRNERQELESTFKANEYTFLKIIEDSFQGNQGFVEFIAIYKSQNAYHQLRERSEFLKENDQWYYYSGKILPQIKWGRNDPCFCGSGKKSKKCHPENPF